MVDGMSIREASRVFGVHRETVRKMLENPVPPGYRIRRPRRRDAGYRHSSPQRSLGELIAFANGPKGKVHYFVLDLPHSDAMSRNHGGVLRRTYPRSPSWEESPRACTTTPSWP